MPSIAQLEELLKSDPRDTFVLYAIAQEHAKAGRHDDAVEFYDRTLAVDPGYCYAYFHKAKSLEAKGRIDLAAETLKQGLDAARRGRDAKAQSEIAAYLDELT